MKKIYFLSVFALTSFFAGAQSQPFITTWEVTAGDLNITIPTTGTGYNYTVDFGDGTVQNNVTGDATHTYSAAGIYTVSITGTFPRIYFQNSLYSGKIASVEQWGDIQWQSMEQAFRGCYNLVINATDAPDLSQVTNLSNMFNDADSFNQSINHWDVSTITDISWMFSNTDSYNQSLNNWNVSNVTDMSNMFLNAVKFNQPLDNWNVSGVTDMSNMFKEAFEFNQIINNWDVSSVASMYRMFKYAGDFNQPLNNWNVSNVVNMEEMFSLAITFDQPIGNWNVSNVTKMKGMFNNAWSFDQPINSWNVSNVTDMSSMFLNSKKFNQSINNWDVSNVTDMSDMFQKSIFDQPIGNWDVASVTDISGMFSYNNEFNQPLDGWNIANVSNMAGMFDHALSFNQPLINWNISNGTNLNAIFRGAANFNQDLTGWNLNNVIIGEMVRNSGLDTANYEAFLSYLDSLNISNNLIHADGLLYCDDIHRNNLINKGWNISGDNLLVNCNSNYPLSDFVFRWNVTSSNYTLTIPANGSGFNYSIDFGDGTTSNNVTGDAVHTYTTPGVYEIGVSGSYPRVDICPMSIEQWGNIKWQTMNNAFNYCYSTRINATDSPDLSQVTDMSYMFYGVDHIYVSLDNWDVSNVTNMEGLFGGCNYNRDLGNWDVSNVTNMSYMFSGGSEFNQDINNWDVSNVTDMSYMFMGNVNFNQPINSWNVSNVSNMKGMFKECSFNQALNNWDVSNVTDMSEMFLDANYFNQNIDNWNVSNVTDMSYMFASVGELFGHTFDQSLNSWNTANVTNMAYMFKRTDEFNQPLNNWDVSNVADMKGMFSETKKFDQDINSWNTSNVVNMNNMFSLAESFDQPLNNWDVSNVLDMNSMFYITPSFNQDISNWNFNGNITLGVYSSSSGFLYASNIDIENYEKLLHRFATLNLSNKILGAQNVEYCNSSVRDYLINNLGWTIMGDIQSSNCNTITGTILYDENSNGCNPSDIPTNGLMVNINDGTYDFTTFSDNGNYNTGVAGTNFTVSLINLPAYYVASPSTATVTFTTSNTEQQDFCVIATQSIEDINVTLLPVSQARPGFEADYQLVVENIGTQSVANASVALNFDDTKQSFTSAIPAPSSTTANQLTFDLANLQPFEKRTVDIVMQTFTPPTVNGDDILDFTAIVTPDANDNTPVDNTFNLAQTVVNSFDPNDKQVLQGDKISLSQAGEYLDYLIRFQNTGTASAINVRVLDTLHPKLDYSTIKPVSSSHDYRVEITDGNHVEFIFENINLPHEAADEPGSHGFVAYKIKPKSNVQVGDFITGDARIYFDFNAPIITNMVSTEIVNLGVNENSVLANKIVVYPNPANDKLNIHLTDGIVLEEVKILNIQGQELISVQGKRESIDVEKLASGIYFIKIKTNRGTLNQQIIKD